MMERLLVIVVVMLIGVGNGGGGGGEGGWWGFWLGINKGPHTVDAQAVQQPQEQEVMPVFVEPVQNVTVAVGRDVDLTCTVDHLGHHQVAWLHLDRKMIVSIGNHVVTKQSRFSVSHDSHKTWNLHVSKVQEEDRGLYMCQVNTAPMMSQVGYLQVFVPPTIVDEESSKSTIVVREKDNVTLRCKGDGFPQPTIMWRREDNKPITKENGREVLQMDGDVLELSHVSRTHMAAYLCIASNSIPPTVSKRITLDVEFAPQMHVPNQLLGVPQGTDIKLECFVEAHPRAITYWEYQDAMVMNTSRLSTHTHHRHYKINMTLEIKELQDSDFGMYKCISKNSIAETDGSITLNKRLVATTPPHIRAGSLGNEEIGYGMKTGVKEEEDRRRIVEEDVAREERRRMEEARQQETERQRLERFNSGHYGNHPTRVTLAPGGVSGVMNGATSIINTLISIVFIYFTH